MTLVWFALAFTCAGIWAVTMSMARKATDGNVERKTNLTSAVAMVAATAFFIAGALSAVTGQ